MTVLDTHVWVWWVSGSRELSERARRLIDAAARTADVYVSSISVWEVALLVVKDRLRLTLDVRDWTAKCEALPFLRFVPA